MIISKINTEIETFCLDSDFRQSYPLIVFWGRGYDLDTQPCLFVDQRKNLRGKFKN